MYPGFMESMAWSHSSSLHNAPNVIMPGVFDKDVCMFLQYGENLLMTACRFQQQAMTEFLMDNGIDYNFRGTKMVRRGTQMSIANNFELLKVLQFKIGQSHYNPIINNCRSDVVEFFHCKTFCYFYENLA